MRSVRQGDTVDHDAVRTEPTVLVVDDEDVVLAAAKASLGRSWRVHTAKTIDAARRSFAAKHPDVVLVDFFLGPERGLDLVLELQRARPSLRVGMFSGRLSTAMAIEAMSLGIAALREKPFQFRDMIRELVTAKA